jgi:hypothetical protein
MARKLAPITLLPKVKDLGNEEANDSRLDFDLKAGKRSIKTQPINAIMKDKVINLPVTLIPSHLPLHPSTVQKFVNQSVAAVVIDYKKIRTDLICIINPNP